VSVSIAGFGLIGGSIARALHERGETGQWQVTAWSRTPAPVQKAVAERVVDAAAATIEEAVREADLAIDCVPDELESKLEILLLLDRMAPPRTVLATPTTRHSIADLASCTYRPTKCVAIVAEASTLAENPEAGAAREILLRTTAQTAPETIALVRDFWERLGFRPRFAPDPAEPMRQEAHHAAI